MKTASVSHELTTSDPKLDSSHKLLRIIRVLADKKQSPEVSLSDLFNRIIDLSSKGYLLYGFKPGRWAAGSKEFTSRSDAFASDLGFLVKQGYIQIEASGEIIQLLRSGREATEKLSLPKLEALVGVSP